MSENGMRPGDALEAVADKLRGLRLDCLLCPATGEVAPGCGWSFIRCDFGISQVTIALCPSHQPIPDDPGSFHRARQRVRQRLMLQPCPPVP